MSDADSTPEPAEKGPQASQEPNAAPKSSPEARIQGLMSVLGRRTTERDDALREAEELRQQLDSAYAQEREPATEVALPPEPPPSQPEPQDDDTQVMYTLDEARAVIEASDPVGHVDANNPHRSQNSTGREPGIAELRRQLDAGWADWQRSELEG